MTTPLRVLILEDSEDDAWLLLRELKRGGYAVTHTRVETADALRTALAAGGWDLVLSDFSMPGFTALDAAVIVRDSGLDLPFIVVSGTIGEETAVEAFKAGAHDFIVKGKLARFLPAVERELREAASRRERREAERALRASEQRYRDLYVNAPVAYFAVGTDGRIRLANRHAAAMLGWASADELVGRAVIDLYAESPEGRARARAVFARFARGEAVRDEELEMRGADGRPVWISLTVLPVVDELGQLVESRSLAVDITERKRTLEELRRHREHLEELVQERTAAADAANQAKSAFLANMSHEIRTPMNAILGFTQLLLRDRALPPDRRQHLEVIGRSGEHLLGLINDVLEMSKIEAGHIQLNSAPFDLRALVGDLELLFRAPAAAKRLLLSVLLTGAVPPAVVGDDGKLRQVLINLVGNAIKFTERGGIVIRAQVSPGATGGLQLAAEVQDTGPGIPSEALERIFLPFEQLVADRPARAGTGLGLAISREYVRLMGGELTVATAVGQGSTFRFAVPLAAAGPGELPAASAGRVRRLAAGQPTRRVLIADDQDDNRALLVLWLGAVGFETREAADGAEAVRVCAEWRPHLVLMDTQMPVLDGLAAIARIRAAPGGREVRICTVSASVFEENRRAALAAGADDFMGKPVQEQVLFAKLGVLLGVEFEMDDPVAHGAAADGATALDPALLAHLPAAWRAEVREAALAADLDRLLALIAGAPDTPPAARGELTRLAESFEYERLLALLGDPPA